MAKEKYKYGHRYKFKSIKVYSSAEWMANSSKKFRRVFDKNEISYIRVQFAFYNKLFDEEDWDANCTIKIFDTTKKDKKEICNLASDHKISKTQNVVNVYESWGVDDVGGFWKKGTYIAEAYIDGTFVGSNKFFIEDVGLVSTESNPYFDVVNVKLYSGNLMPGILSQKIGNT